MNKIGPTADDRTLELGVEELCLRIGTATFGIFFLDLENAREAAHHINLSGRDVEIFEKKSGRVVEVCGGAGFPGKASNR